MFTIWFHSRKTINGAQYSPGCVGERSDLGKGPVKQVVGFGQAVGSITPGQPNRCAGPSKANHAHQQVD